MTHELWFTDNGRDMLGDDVPNDELNVAYKAGLHFGFPFCHQGDVADPEFGAQRACSTTEPPVQKLGAHVAAIGFTFYTGTMFPARYKNAAIIAQHGSWNRSTPSGYRVMAAFTDGRRVTGYEPFVDGFLPGVGSRARRARGDGRHQRPPRRRAATAGRIDPDQRRHRQSPHSRQLQPVGEQHDAGFHRTLVDRSALDAVASHALRRSFERRAAPRSRSTTPASRPRT